MLSFRLSDRLFARLCLSAWLALVAVVTLRTCACPPTTASVVPIYQSAAQRWSRGDDLYAPVLGQDVYRNPPIFAALLAPFAHWPPKLLAILWRLGLILLYGVGLCRVHGCLFSNPTFRSSCWLFTLAFWPMLPAFNNGQVNLLLAGLLLHALADLTQNRPGLAAIGLSFAAALKIYPLAVGLLVGLVLPRRFLGWWLLGLLAALALPFALQSPEYVLGQYQSFRHYLSLDDRSLAELPRAPRDWTIVPRTWLNWPVAERLEQAVMLGTGLAAAGLVLHWLRRDWSADSWLKLLVLGSVWMTAFGPATESNTYAVAAGVVACAVLRWPNRWTLAGYALLVSVVLRGLFPNDWMYQVLGPQPLGMVLILAGVLTHREPVSTSAILWQARISLANSKQAETVARSAPPPPRPVHFGP